MDGEVSRRVAEAARHSYGRLVALLARRSGDIARAEDDLSEALGRALELWPRDGVPANPDAWLLTVARNLQRDRARSAPERLSAPLPEEGDMPMSLDPDPDAIPDERLRLMFACAHPAIDEAIRTPLILQTVLGRQARDIGAAFRVSGEAMAQRLVRAKQKIKLARIPFSIPERSDMAGRLDAVLEAIYGAYAIHWIDGGEAAEARDDLASEALFLAELVAALLPGEPEALGLAALMLHAEARRPARDASAVAYVPLGEQDTSLWSRAMIIRANGRLLQAQALRRIGRFQLEAAIQAVHAERLFTGRVNGEALVQLYDALVQLAPSAGALVGLAAALGQAGQPETALSLLDRNSEAFGADFQPAWAARAQLLADTGRSEASAKAYDAALALTIDPAVRRYLEARRDALPSV